MSNPGESKFLYWIDRILLLAMCGTLVVLVLGGTNFSITLIAWVVMAVAVIAGVILFLKSNFCKDAFKWFKRVFKSRISKVLGSIFAVVFVFEFFQKANTDSYHPKIWEGIMSGGWHGGVAVLMVLAFVVLWKFANKDAPKI